MSEFCLSDKIESYRLDLGKADILFKEHVKEFIRLLKEEVNKSIPKLHGYNSIIIGHINKLAGEKLK